ncbi:hypothetical protein EDD99_8119 [Streptomyces sp. 846.5]|nr:DUF6409 family protein [Streptomyces sp. 846.5]TDT93310.1 hypothetical protein EDD99_8119 [Streptomyces sp. 846.5]
MMELANRTERPVPTVAELVPGTLVTVRPLPGFDRIPASCGVVLDAWGDCTLVWFWGLGLPVAGKSVHAIFPREITVLTTTLETVPSGAFESIAAGLDTLKGQSWYPSELQPLIERVEEVRARRAAQLAERA